MAARYWVGGAGNWSSTTKWSTTSGGASGASVPTSVDDAIFDANSGGKFTATVDTPQSVNSITITPSAAVGIQQIALSARLTTNNLTTTGTAGNNRIWFRGNTYGIAQDFVVNGTVSISDCDFRDIYVIGTAAPISGTRIGDLRGIRGITASTPKTVYWNLAAGGNWSATSWAATSGGATSDDNFPLAQDTAVIENTGLNTSATVTLNAALPFIGTIDMSTRTNAATIAISSGNVVYGNWVTGSGITYSGTLVVTFSGRNTQTITSNGQALSFPVTVDTYGGTVELADALDTGTRTLTVTSGTFDTKNYNVTAGSFEGFSAGVKALKLGSSTITLSAGSFAFYQLNNQVTVDAGTSTIICTGTTTSTYGGGLSLYNLSFTSTAAGVHSFLSAGGALTVANLTVTAPSSANLRELSFATGLTVTGTFTIAGATAVRRIFVRSNTVGTPRTLTVDSLSAQDCDFRDITIAGAAAGSSPTRAGDCGGNTGITFPAAKTVYWNLAGAQNWSSAGWAPSSGGTPDINQFPLAQDTAVFDDAGTVTGTITMDKAWNIGTFDASPRTTAFAMSFSGQPAVYKNVLLSATGSGIYVLSFYGRGEQFITSNGATNIYRIVIQSPNAIIKLNDAISLGDPNQGITISAGGFDAVTYNVTLGVFACSAAAAQNPSLRMGTGTWTVFGTGTCWNLTTPDLVLYKGTADIVLSNNTTTARTFAGNSYSYNKLTIGGATGTSTTTITGNNQFTELASTKTVAHTIALGTTFQTFGAWTVTGTVGNVVTLTGTGVSHVIAGACTSGINYLAMGSIGFAATSPGEFYAGANSTGTAAAPVYRTAKPADSTRYWVGGTGTWSTSANWSDTSGGAGGKSVPRSHDAVVFDSASSAASYTMTFNNPTEGIRMGSLTVAGPASGSLTLAGTTAIAGIHGDVTLPATGLTRTYTGQITLSGSTTGRTLTPNGVTLPATAVNGVGCEWTLGSALDIGSADLRVINGAFIAATYNVTAGGIVSDYGNSRTYSLGAGTYTLSGGTPTINFGTTETNRANLTFISGTSQINLSNAIPGISGNNQTFYNVAFTSASAGTVTINGANTFNNLSFTGITAAGLKNISVTADQAINDTLSFLDGTNAMARLFARSDTIGTTRTLTCANFVGTDVDFRDITIAGAAAPVSGTRLGDCKGNSGITFDAGVNKYWVISTGENWNSGFNPWSTATGGAGNVNDFPLAQDTVVFQSSLPTSGQTVTLNTPYNIGTIDMSARTSNTMTLALGSQSPTIYGNWINGTGTTLTGTNTLTFAGRNSQTITSAGNSFPGVTFTISTIGGSVTLQDALTVNSIAVVTHGTFNANNYSVNIVGFSANGTPLRSINIGSATWTLSASGTVWSTATPTNLTVTGTGTISLTSASAKTFAGGGASYSGITLNQGGAGTLTITGNNTFANISNTYKAAGATTIAMGTTTQRVGNFTASGEAGRVLTVQGTSASSPATLIFTGSGQATTPTTDYLAITGVRAFDLTTTWYAGANSTNNGSLGWYFEAGGGGPIAVFITESSTAADAQSASTTMYAAAVETTTASDAAAAGLVYLGTLNESATAADVVEAFRAFLAEIAEAATSAELISASLTLAAAISELTAVADSTAVSSRVTLPSIAEVAQAADALSGGLLYLSDISEALNPADTTAALLVINRAIFESLNASEATQVAASTFGAVSAEATRPLDASQAATTGSASLSESAAASETGSTLIAALTVVSEQATAQDIDVAGLAYAVALAETAAAQDQSSVAPSNFSAVALAVAQAVDSQNAPGSVYSAAVPIQGAGITDSFIGAYLWNPIDDSQTPNWQNVPNPQGSGWVLIPTDDDPNWQPTLEP